MCYCRHRPVFFLIMKVELTRKTEGTVRRCKQGRGGNESECSLGSLEKEVQFLKCYTFITRYASTPKTYTSII